MLQGADAEEAEEAEEADEEDDDATFLVKPEKCSQDNCECPGKKSLWCKVALHTQKLRNSFVGENDIVKHRDMRAQMQEQLNEYEFQLDTLDQSIINP